MKNNYSFNLRSLSGEGSTRSLSEEGSTRSLSGEGSTRSLSEDGKTQNDKNSQLSARNSMLATLRSHFSPPKAAAKLILSSTLLTLIFLLGIIGNGWGQASIANYALSSSTSGSLALDLNSNAVDMSSGTSLLVTSSTDNGSSATAPTIGFDFWYMGTRYTQFSASSNGLIRLGSTIISTTSYGIGQATAPIIAPFAGDLETSSTGKVHYKLVGTAPNRCLVVEFLNMGLDYTGSYGNPNGTYQARLYESNSIIEFVYGSMLRNSSAVNSGTITFNIGIGTSTTVLKCISNLSTNASTSTFTALSPTIPASGTQAIADLSSASNGSRKVYTFTPSQSAAPTNLTFSSIAATSCTLNWTDNSSDEVGFAIYRSTDNTNFTFVTTTAANAVTYAATGLNSSTLYYWKVYALREATNSSVSNSAATLSSGTTASYTTAGTYSFKVPDGVCSVNVQAWGAGGGGGVSNATKGAGGGGGGGAYATLNSVTVTPGSTVTLVVGAGGSGNTVGSGGSGGNSTFNTNTVIAAGGSGGGYNNSGVLVSGGTGGQSSACTPTAGAYSGGNGANPAVTVTNATVSGGSGASAGTAANGGNASTSTAGAAVTGGVAGVAGYSGGLAGGGVGTAGNAGGGGGSGSRNSGTAALVAGTGGAGKVEITWTALSGTSATPVVTSPICVNATSVSGTSTEANGTIIEVFNGSTSLGTTTVTSSAWTKSGLSALTSGASITAKANACGKNLSAASTAVVVATSVAPVISGSYCAGATSVTGTSTEATGSTVTVYKNGVSWGTTTTITSNNWTVSGLALAASDVITAKVQATSKCISDASTSKTVNSLPTVSSSVTETSGSSNNDGTVCTGASVTLAGSGASSYSWSGSITNNTAFTATTTTTYTVTGTDGNNCQNTATSTITVNSLPTVSSSVTETSGTANDGTVCAGESVTLAGSGASSYTWSGGITNNSAFTATTTTTYTVTGTDANGCQNTANRTVTVTPVSATPTITGPICPGNTTVSGTGVNGSTIKVIRSGSEIQSGSATWSGTSWSITVSSVSAGDNLTATQTESGKCVSAASSAYVVITPASWGNIQWPTSQPQSICGTPVTFYGQVYKVGTTPGAGQGAGLTADLGWNSTNTDPSTWSNWTSATFHSQQGDNDEFRADLGAGLTAGTWYYAFRYSYAGCPIYGGYSGVYGSGGSNGQATVPASQTATLSSAVGTNAQTVCKGTSITNITYTLGNGANNATLTSGSLPTGVSGSVSGGVLTISGTPSASGVYTYTYATSGTSNCAFSFTGTITVSETLDWANLQFPSTAAICVGGNASIYGKVYESGVTEAAGAGAGITAQYGYSSSNSDPSGGSWTWGSASFNAQQISDDEFVGTFGSSLATGTYYYTMRFTYNGCTVYGGFNAGPWNGTTNVNGTLTVNTLPAITGQPTTPTAICSGSGTQTMTVTATGAGLTYQWRKGGVNISNGGVFGGATTATLTLTNPTTSDAGSYDCVVSGTCTPSVTSNAVTVTVNAIPTITGTTPASRCGSGTVALGATASAGTINWYAAASGGASLGTGTSYTTPSLSSTTTYYVDATSSGCTTGSRTAIIATVNDVPTITGTTPNSRCGTGTVVLGATASAGTVNWYAAASGGASLGTGTSFTTPSISTTTTYYVDATANGCTTAARTAVTATVNATPTVTFTAQPGATGCLNTDLTYTTESGQSNYLWTFPGTLNTDYTITSGGTSSDNTVTLKYLTTGSKTVTVNYTSSGCSAVSATSSTATTIIAGPTVNAGADATVCSGQSVQLGVAVADQTGTPAAQSGTIGANAGNPLRTGWGNARTQNLYTAAELTASGMTVGSTIKSISLEVTVAGENRSSMEIGYKFISSATTTLTTTFLTGFTTAYTGSFTGAVGVKTFTFSIPTTAWNGTDNLVFNYCFTENVTGSTTATVKALAAAGNVSNQATADGASPQCATSVGSLSTRRPFITITHSNFSWSPSTALSSSNISNPIASPTTTTVYTLTASQNGCSASDAVSVTVAGTAPATPTASVSGSSTINVGGTTTLTSSAGASTLWYTAASGGSSVGSGDNWQTPVQCSSGSVTYYAEDNNGTCASASRTAVSFTVRPMVVSNPANGLICQAGGSVTLSAQLTGGTDITWSPNTNLSTTSGASTVASPTTTNVYTMSATVAGCGSVSGTQTVGVIDAVAFTPTSNPAAVCAGNPAELASNLSSSNFSVLSATFSPLTPPGSGVTNLIDGSTGAGVTLSGGDYDDGGWGGIPIGFSYNFFGQNFSTLAVGTNGLVMFGTVPGYDATAGNLGQFSFNTVGGAFPNANNPGNVIALLAHDADIYNYNTNTRVRYWTQGIAPTRKFVLDFVAMPTYATPANFSTAQLVLNETTGIVEIYVTTAPAGTGNSAKIIGLQNGAKTIGAVAGPNNNTPEWNYRTTAASNLGYKFVPGAEYSFQWSTGGSNIDGATSTGYTTANLNTPGTVSYSVAAYNPNTQCTTTQSVEITVNALPSAPVSAGNVTECANAANQNLVVSVGSGETADWYAASSSGSVLASPSNGTGVTSYSVPANATATYYAQARNTTTGCVSSSRTGVTFTTKAVPTAPTASAVSYCQGATSSSMTASTPVGSNTQNWYDVSTGGTPLAGAPTPSTSTATTLTYYVAEVGTNGCESSRTSVTATITGSPAIPTGISASRCGTGTVSLGVETSINGTIKWYSDAGLTNLLDSYANCTTPNPCTTNWTTPSISSTTVYYATKTNVAGCQSLGVAVTATVNPDITASVSNSASSTSACGGGSITFTATPTNGGASPSYQWYLNGATVGTNSTTYELASPANNDQIYVAMTPSAQTCLTSASATNSSTITLTSSASTPTVAIQSSASSAICPGTSVTFSVNSSANMGATPSYVWKLNGSPISGATNATYTSTGLVNNDQITLEMTSSLNGLCVTQPSATSSAITTTVNTATSITAQPVATSACASGTANFTVTGAGQGTLTYQWKKNTVNITGNGTATSSSLTLSGVGAGDVADYTVVVTGACGNVTSNTAAFTINSATAISAQPTAVTQCAGTTANFSVTGTGQGTLSYQWRKDGSALNSETNSTLAVTNIATINAGQYSVIVTGGCGSVTSSNALLTVNSGTSISTQPAASTLCAGNTVNFSVTASGTGALSYQWKQDGTNVGTNSAALSVANTQAENAGTYTVVVTGGCGTTTSNAAVLTVNPATSITTQPVGTAGCEGQNTTFTVVAAGTGSLSYQWKYGATNVGTNSASYNIPSTSTANDGNYSVVVTGGCGNATSSTVALNVYASPTTNATISTADITDATLCGKNSVSVVGNSPGNDSQGEWSVVGGFNIVVDDPGSTSATFTVQDNSLLGGATRKFVWAHVRTTSGNNCYTSDTITVDFKQPTITEISALVQDGDVLWNGLTNSSWSTSSNWYQYTVSNSVGRWIRMTSGEPTASTKVYTLSNGNAGVCVNSTNAPALGNGEVASNVYVGDGATLNLSSGTLSIAGDLTNNGTINPSSSTITFNGTGAQKITGTGIVANFNNLIINKASGTLTLEQPAKVAGTLTMTQGDIITDATNILEIGTNASSVGSVSWTAGTVRGPLKRWFAASANSSGNSATDKASGIFPVGGNISAINPWTGVAKGVMNRYAQVNFTTAPSTGGYIIAKYEVGNPGLTAGLPIWTPTQYIQNFEEEGYWDITPYSAAGVAYGAMNSTEYTLKLRLNTPSTNDGSYITAPERIRIISSKGPNHTSWVVAGTQGAGQSQTSTGDYLLEETGVTGFSWFNGGGDNFNPLPVELTSFTGVCDNGIINLTWQTASEFNSSHFDVEKSRDGENWQLLTKISSAGTSNELITYQSTDQNGTEGNNYFRLRQVDVDGTEKVYDPINVSCSEVTTGYFSSFPNPSGSSFQVIVNNKELLGVCTMNIVDASGKVIEQRDIEVKDGINMFVINQELTPGMYFLNISNGSKSTPVLRHAIK